jgi:glutathione S-transferase
MNMLRLHGLDLSYYTGKVEAYLRAKGLAYELVEMDIRDFRHCARQTGVAQMPQLELPDGTWLTDSSAIIEHFESVLPEPALYPGQSAVCFIAHLLEDFGDEWLWRPAMYYRWAFAADAALASERLARGLLRDVPLPLALRRATIRMRQRRLFLKGDGVTRATAPVIEGIYLDVLDAMQAALASRPFLLGQRPTQADMGFFGSMFRHFSSDPTPARIMRARAPAVLEWVARLWNLQPSAWVDAPQPSALPPDLAPLLTMVCGDYLPALASHDHAWQQGARRVSWNCRGVAFSVPVNPYQVHCLQQLRTRYQSLADDARAQVNNALIDCHATHGPAAVALLQGGWVIASEAKQPTVHPHRLPQALGPRKGSNAPLSRQWR